MEDASLSGHQDNEVPQASSEHRADAVQSPIFHLRGIPLTPEQREIVVGYLFSKPLAQSVVPSVVQHTLVADQYLLAVMSNDPNLSVLDVSHSLCTDVSIVALTDALPRNAELKSLVLDANPISDISAFLLAQALCVNRGLVSLSLAHVAITEVGVEFLAQSLIYNDILKVCSLDDDVRRAAPTATRQLDDLLIANRYPRLLKSVYRFTRLERHADDVDVDPTDGVLGLDFSINHAEEGNDDARVTTTLDTWGINFLFLTLQSYLANGEMKVDEQTECIAIRRSRVLRVDVSFHGNAQLGDDLVEALVRCVRQSNADKNGSVSVRFGTINLSGTSVTATGVAKLTEVLEAEGDLIASSCAPEKDIPLLGCVVLDDIGLEGDEIKNAVDRLQWGLSLRKESNVVKKAALRLSKQDPSLVHLVLATTVASTAALDTGSASPAASPTQSNQISTFIAGETVQDSSIALLLPLLKESTSLLSLAFPSAHLSSTSAKCIEDLLIHNCFLQLLDLRGCDRLCIREGAVPIAEGLSKNRTLLSLNLASTGMDVRGGVAIAEALKGNRTLTVLDLSENPMITDSAGEAIISAVGPGVNMVLRELRLRGTGISEELQAQIESRVREAHEPPRLRRAIALLSPSPTTVADQAMLSTINLSGARADDQLLRDSSMELLAEALRGNRRVTHLDVSNNSITYDGMRVLLSTLAQDAADSNLKFLNVSCNPIYRGLEFAASCIEFLRCHKCIEEMDLRSTDLRVLGVQAILDALLEDAFPPTVAVLHVENNLATPSQEALVKILVRSHRVGSTIRSFVKELWSVVKASNEARVAKPLSFVNGKSLNRNRMSKDDLVYLICSTLMLSKMGCKKLVLSNNFIDDTALEALCVFIESGLQIQTLDIQSNEVTDKGVDRLLVALLKSSTLKDIVIAKNPQVSAVSLSALEEGLKLSRQPAFLKSTMIAFCRREEGANQITGPRDHCLNFSSQLCDHMTDERFGMLCDALLANSAPSSRRQAELDEPPMDRVVELDLSNNHVGNKTLKRLLNIVKSEDERVSGLLSSLQRISLKNTMIRGTEAGLLAVELIRQLPSVTHIDLSCNELMIQGGSMKKDVLPALGEILASNDMIMELNVTECGVSEDDLEPIASLLELNRSDLKPTMRSLRSNDPHLVSISLSDVNLSRRNVFDLIRALEDNFTLRDLDLSGNDIGADVASRIIDWIGVGEGATSEIRSEISAIRRDFRRRQSTMDGEREGGDSAVTSVLPNQTGVLSSPCRLVHLLLERNNFDDSHAKSLHDALFRNRTLQSLSLISNQISPATVYDIFVSNRDLFERNDTLNEFLVDGQDIDVFAFERFSQRFIMNLTELLPIKQLLKGIKQNVSTITEVSFPNTNDLVCDTVCYELAEVLLENTHVEVLRLSHGCITDEGLVALCRCLMINRSVQLLDLSFNSISDTGVSTLFDVLSVNSSITSLDLAGNVNIGPVGVAKLQAMFNVNHAVTHVGIDREGLSQRSMNNVDLGILLNRSHPNLKALLLSEQETLWRTLDVSNSAAAHNKIFDDAACSVLCDFLRDNTILEEINMSHNELSFESCFCISELLRANKGITSLDLSYNTFNTGVMHLIKALRDNDFVVQLSLEGCHASEMYLTTIQLLVAVNQETSELKREALDMLEDPSGHRTLRVCGDIQHEVLPSTRPCRRKVALDDASMPTLGAVMDLTTAVQHMTLSYNHISSDGLQWMCTHVLDHHPNIVTLDLSHNRLDDEAMKTLRECASTVLGALRDLNVTYNCLSDKCVSDVVQLVEEHSHVERVYIGEGNIGLSASNVKRIQFYADVNLYASAEAREQLIAAFNNNSTQQCIDLSGYHQDGRRMLNERYLMLVGAALSGNDYVRTLMLDDCRVDDAILELLCVHVVDAYRGSGLQVLSLCSNNIEDVSALIDMLIAAGSHGPTSSLGVPPSAGRGPSSSIRLSCLRLAGNKMNLKSARSLASLLRQNDHIQELDVSDNEFGRIGAVLIQSAMLNNSSVERIQLQGKGVPPSIASAAEFTAASIAHAKNTFRGQADTEGGGEVFV